MKDLANRIEQIARGEQSLFSCSEDIEKLAHTFAKLLIKKQIQTAFNHDSSTISEETDYVTIDLNSLSNEDCKTLGTENILYKTFCELGLPNKLKSLGLTDGQIHVAAANIIARAAFPASELATHQWLIQHSALD